MPVIRKSVLVPYAKEQIYALVNQVNEYPKFLPWCRQGHILEESEAHMLAKIQVAKGPLNHSFTTRNVLVKNSRIEVQLVDGPFRDLYGFWAFEDHGQQNTLVTFELTFEFLNKITSFAITPVFHSIMASIVHAFAQRARAIYAE